MRGKTTVRKAEQKQNQTLSLLVLIAAMLMVAVIVHVLTGGKFITAKNVEIMISNSIYPSFIAWALCFLSACGYTDLSLGGVLVLGSFAACAFGGALWLSRRYPGRHDRGHFAGVRQLRHLHRHQDPLLDRQHQPGPDL